MVKSPQNDVAEFKEKKNPKWCRAASADRCTKQTGTTQPGKGKEPKERKLRTWKPIKPQMRCWWEKDSLFFPIQQKVGGTQWDHSLKRSKKTPEARHYFCTNWGIHHRVFCGSSRYKLFKGFRQIPQGQVQQALPAQTLLLRTPRNPSPPGAGDDDWAVWGSSSTLP